MNIREISDVFKDTANQITAIKSYNFGWASDRTRSTNTEDYQELNEFPRVFFSVPTITGSDQTRKQDTYQVTLFFDDLLGYDNNGDADLTLQLDKWAALQEYANYFVQRLNKVKQSILPNYLFIPEAPSITFDSFTGLQRMITVQLSFTLVVPTNCEPIVSTLIECIANIITSSNLTASITRIIKLASTLQASSSLSASVLVSKLAQSNLNTESSLSANIQIAKLPSSSLNAGATLSADALVTRLFAASLNGNGSIFANPLITKFAASSLNTASSLNASALVSKLASSSLTGAGTLAADLTVTASVTLLLDLYPNAAAAYSLRKLRTAYTGNAIRVRRSSDNAEQDIGFTALGVLDESVLTTFCGVGNGFVTTWYDQSGNARNATQTTAANQCRIVNTGVVEQLNNKPAINAFAANTLKLYVTNYSNIINRPVTIFSVLKNDILPTNAFNGVTFNIAGDVQYQGGGGRYEQIIDNTNIIVSQIRGLSPDIRNNLNSLSHIVHSSFYKTNTLQQRVNSIDSSEVTPTGTIFSIASNFTIINGTNFNAAKRFQEAIIYESDLFSNRVDIETNINTHYAIY